MQFRGYGARTLCAALFSLGALFACGDSPLGVPVDASNDLRDVIADAPQDVRRVVEAPDASAVRRDVTVANGSLVLTTNAPVLMTDCLPGLPACADVDRDTINDFWEDMVIDVFRPVLRMDEMEQALRDARRNERILARVAPSGTASKYMVYMSIAWARDYGCGLPLTSHDGDPERVVLEVEAIANGVVRIVQAYTAAHEGTGVDEGQVFLTSELNMLEFVDFGATKRWRVYPSRDKHATFANVSLCSASTAPGLPCTEEFCAPDNVVSPDPYDVLPAFVNVGEMAAPRITDLTSIGFPNEEAWADQRFCGGRRPPGDKRDDCPGAIRRKFLISPF